MSRVDDLGISRVEKRTRGVGKSYVTVRVGLIMDVTKFKLALDGGQLKNGQ